MPLSYSLRISELDSAFRGPTAPVTSDRALPFRLAMVSLLGLRVQGRLLLGRDPISLISTAWFQQNEAESTTGSGRPLKVEGLIVAAPNPWFKRQMQVPRGEHRPDEANENETRRPGMREGRSGAELHALRLSSPLPIKTMVQTRIQHGAPRGIGGTRYACESCLGEHITQSLHTLACNLVLEHGVSVPRVGLWDAGRLEHWESW